ncbi:hypothetical protein MFLO_00240 [Listeria floridensis FSL S10-1187]|uniref:Peptidase S9 prolyl oligopeptidase catalytic domain-containing protein n=1 Tax=Listeria floridensis FSL S10-1187 TaxID=1265817 RepID=A0ABN0RI73_9LIST|nr:esterase [Listeria floridensis]EUJ33636.1 hypothetical protein MFLO_00240 [Listeria floridensis FSL S10-1187]
MIQVTNQNFKNIPALHVVRQDLHGEKLPTVFFYHGFQSEKELYLHYGYFLAEQGFRVILPDAKFHGERKRDTTSAEQAVYFWDTVQANIDELAGLRDELVRAGLSDAERIGVGGVSMGAITSLGILARYDWVKVAVSLMGSAYYGEFANELVEQATAHGMEFPFDTAKRIKELEPYDLSEQLEKVNGRALLLWHGKKDDVVPFKYSEKLYDRLLEEEQAEQVEFVVDDQAKHKVSIDGINRTTDFFQKNAYKRCW